MHFVKRGKISVVKESLDNLELSTPIDYTAELVLTMGIKGIFQDLQQFGSKKWLNNKAYPQTGLHK